MERIIKNFKQLATTPLRVDALSILEAGYKSINTKNVIKKEIRLVGKTLFILNKSIDLSIYNRIFFIGIGKCAADAAIGIENVLGDYIDDGIVVDMRKVALKKIRSFVGTHPFPSEQNVAITRLVKELLENANERDLIITVISGGGSSLLCLPHKTTHQVLTKITSSLMKQGATIDEVNTIRKHTSDIQGGQFAKLAYPARVVSIIFSDVPGDDLSVIASGPTVMDTTQINDAENIFKKYDIKKLCGVPECEIIETPKELKYFENVDNILLVTNKRALNAMKKKAELLEYKAVIVDSKIEGEAREVGVSLANKGNMPRTCFLYGGETTVTINPSVSDGVGGRCQELALSSIPFIDTHSILVASASDGWDNTDMAGAIADSKIRNYAKMLSLESGDWLEKNQSYGFFEKTKGHINTGRTGMNVSDLYFTLNNSEK